MHTLELFFRFAAISQLVVLAVVLVKEHRGRTSAMLIAAWALSGACYLVVVPAYRDWHWEIWSYVFITGAIAWPVLFWLVAKALFRDGFRLRWLHLAVMVVVATVSLASGAPATRAGFDAIVAEPESIVVPQIITVAFTILALVAVVRDWRDDLVEKRRRLRTVLIAGSGLYTLIVGTSVLLMLADPEAMNIQLFETMHLGIVLLLCTVTSIALYSVHTEFIAAKTARSPPAERLPDDAAPIIAELKRMMDEDQAYCERGLTIGSLATKIREKEYKLRRVINGEFGYRNFNDFLNQHRVAEAARRLVAPETRHLPVLTIALDVGYSSLGPFNRAFKEQLQMTPTEYRAASRTQAEEFKFDQ